jgi:hypothetical protein
MAAPEFGLREVGSTANSCTMPRESRRVGNEPGLDILMRGWYIKVREDHRPLG